MDRPGDGEYRKCYDNIVRLEKIIFKMSVKKVIFNNFDSVLNNLLEDYLKLLTASKNKERMQRLRFMVTFVENLKNKYDGIYR